MMYLWNQMINKFPQSNPFEAAVSAKNHPPFRAFPGTNAPPLSKALPSPVARAEIAGLAVLGIAKAAKGLVLLTAKQIQHQRFFFQSWKQPFENGVFWGLTNFILNTLISTCSQQTANFSSQQTSLLDSTPSDTPRALKSWVSMRPATNRIWRRSASSDWVWGTTNFHAT